jgi:hypothetical protein
MPPSTKKHSASKRRGPPLQDLRMNPFTSPEQHRINYPGLDAAFQFNSSLSSANLSICSPDRSSIAAPPSDLNMSIGARAAIYEHTRYVSKFGLEGEVSKPSTPSHSAVHGLDEWDRIMDDVPCNTSIVADSHVSTSFTSHYFHGNRSYLDSSMINRALDTTYEDQSDFFNSSKVMQYLATPEKNKQKVDEASRLARLGVGVMARNGNDSICHSHCGSTSGTELEQSGMIGLFRAAMKFEKECFGGTKGHGHENDHEVDEDRHEDEEIGGESFVSYHEPNMSVIDLQQQSLLLEEDAAEHQIIQIYDDDQNVVPETGSAIDLDGGDIHCSFVSYQEPDLTVLSRNCGEEIHCASRSPSEFEQQSEFHVDVSEILAPSEFENRFSMASYAAKLGTLSENKRSKDDLTNDVDEERLRYDVDEQRLRYDVDEQRLRYDVDEQRLRYDVDEQRLRYDVDEQRLRYDVDEQRLRYSCASPILDEFHDRYHVHDDEVSWPTDSPASRPSNREKKFHKSLLTGHQDKEHDDDSPKINRSLINYFESTTRNGKKGDMRIRVESEGCSPIGNNPTTYANVNDSSSKIHSSIASAIKTQQKASQKSISIRERQYIPSIDTIPRQIGTKTHGTDIKVDDIHDFDNLSPLSPPRSRTSRSRGSSLIATGASKSQKTAPVRMSLRERYSHRDRFEDTFTVPSYASTLSATPRTYDEDEIGSIHKSPSGPFAFDNDFDSSEQASYDHKRFAA